MTTEIQSSRSSDTNERDYKKDDYSPRDVTEVVFDVDRFRFEYRPHSQLVKGREVGVDLAIIPLPRLSRQTRIRISFRRSPGKNYAAPLNMDLKFELPTKVWIGRNLGTGFRELYVLRGAR